MLSVEYFLLKKGKDDFSFCFFLFHAIAVFLEFAKVLSVLCTAGLVQLISRFNSNGTLELYYSLTTVVI